MLHELLGAYLQRIHQVVSQCSGAHVEHYTEEILTPERVNLRIRIRLGQGRFPHHKHVPDAVLPSTKPDIAQVVAEAAQAELGAP
ncbi:MAG: hypothetical protein OXG72_08690 [Acidobacteria bacterium]|nr:hypothetical protein [Acidobacteriota bacterium]